MTPCIATGHWSAAPQCSTVLILLAMMLSICRVGAGELSLATLDATRSRPLFSPTRRPPPVAAPSPQIAQSATAPAPPSPPDIVLAGVIMGSDTLLAVVKQNRTTKTVRVGVGRELDGWTLVAVEPRQIRLQRGAQIFTLTFPGKAAHATGAASEQAEAGSPLKMRQNNGAAAPFKINAKE
jgi:general secretion pathway protein N